jgi:hypothetical protein
VSARLCFAWSRSRRLIDAYRERSRGRAAELKALALLKHWLSPAQLAQYNIHGHFEVTGCHSGKRYRIRQTPQMNVDELDESGARTVTWCFGPEGKLPIGDVMLAQKIALENHEQAGRTSARVAGSKRPSEPPPRRRRTAWLGM